MLEKEVKILLTEKEYLILKEAFRFSAEIMQRNNYYRSEQCAEKRISVRVREAAGKCLLQVKKPVGDRGSLAVREELEREISGVPQVIPSELLKELCGVEDDAVFIGSLTTRRLLCYDHENVELALDRSEYLGCVDHELEAEYTGDYPAKLMERIAALGIDISRPAAGKYSRFCRRLAEAADNGPTS
ncbi:MAG: CYTH domain-containing protein [Ruminococcus sp.]|nr:CYTH domain-containing protein [Ruminococcus sp.]